MKKGTVNLDGLKYIDEEVYQIIKAYTISKNDLLQILFVVIQMG